MTRRFVAHFDGKTLVPEAPLDLPTGMQFDVTLEERAKATTLAEMLQVADQIGFDSESIAEMNNAIEQGCEQVDPDGW